MGSPGATTSTVRAALYCRVSCQEQDVAMQVNELRLYVEKRGWTLAGEYVDQISGAKSSRPGLDKLMADARERRIDTVCVWALDRFGRSLRHLVTTIDELTSLGVGFVAVTQGIDTTNTSPTGTLTIQILGAVAQFEREMIRARVRAGVAKAKASGKRLGRPQRWTRAQVDKAESLRDAGRSWRETAMAVGLPVRTVRRALATVAKSVLV